MQGAFITLEGIDGAGKSAQTALLHQALQQAGYNVQVTREPGGDDVGEAVRTLLLEKHMVLRAELLLFLAARAQNTAQIIMPALQAGNIVLCDRYIDSSVAYQGYARGLNPAEIEQMNSFATGTLTPHLTILLDIAPQTGLARQMNRNRMEAEGIEFLQRARQGFLTVAENNKERFLVLDASQSLQTLHNLILERVQLLLQQRNTQPIRPGGAID